MEAATVLNISICAMVIALAGYAVYTAFGPPSQDLGDPFEDHED